MVLLLFAATLTCAAADGQEAKSAPAPLRFDIETSVTTALKNSPSLDKAKAQIDEAQGKYAEVRTGRNPSLTMNGSFTRIEPPLSFSVNGALVPIISANNWDANLTFQYLITDFGRLGKNEDSMRYNLMSVDEAYYTNVNDLIFRAREAFFRILEAQGMVEVQREYVESANAHLKVANDRYAAGDVPRFDVYRAEASYEGSVQNLITAENTLELARKSFLEVLNLSLDTPFEVEFPIVDRQFPHLDLDKGNASALANRPELRQLALMIEMGKTLVDAARMSKNAQLLFTSVYDGRNATGFAQGLQWQSTVALALPVYDKGVAKAKTKQAVASVDQMKATYADVTNKVLLDVRRAYLVHRDAVQRIETTRKQVKAAGEAKRIAELRYKNGFSSIAETLDTQADYEAAQGAYIINLFEYGIAVAGWKKATASDIGELRKKKETPCSISR